MHLWIWWSTCIHVKAVNDSLKPGDRLNASGGTTNLYSKNGIYLLTFRAGFLGILNEVTNGYYFVWIGNKNQPVDYNSAVLSLSHSGVLKIESLNHKPIILYSPPQPIHNTVATLLNTGNFVLQQLHRNGTNTTLWQSFDYPSNTLFPTMKLGINHKTGLHWFLVSITHNSVLPGAFHLEWEPMGQELVIRRRGILYWRSGKLRNNRFEHIPEDAQRMLYYTIVSNVDEDSFSFTTTNIEDTWWISSNGQLSNFYTTFVWADLCYGYNDADGCQRWQDIPMCRNRGDVFQSITGHFNYDFWSEPNTTYYVSDCRDICWSNCNCIGFKEKNTNGTGCVFLHSESSYNVPSVGEDFYLLGNLTQHSGNSTTKSQTPGIKWKWISAVIACFLFIICLSILVLALKKRKYALQEKKRKEMVIEIPPSTSCNMSCILEDFQDDLEKAHLKVFNYTSIITATNGFSSENKLGQGGFGPVYKLGFLSIRGYMSPEYAMEGTFSIKSDVYSFGVLLLEIVSGRRNTSFYDPDGPMNLIGHAWELWKEGVCLQLVDPSLNESFDPDEVQRCIHVGLLCVEHYANDRPTMSDIISMLTNKSVIVSLPQRPAFYVQRDNYDENLSSKVVYTASTDEITTSFITESK
ncbi:hypothetical protein VNO78_06672 [Psophocarpus tetragonolobus]|uniref:Bulb-type lectin domain-containing protein n=1 Tax=Psophocarpus tetragonolobus TaxID=3891 RepID=A0AAN9SSJ5_PSOTE